MNVRVYDYKTNVALKGMPSKQLVQKSVAVETGAVFAWLDNGVWQYLDACNAEHYRNTLKIKVRTVYVGERS